jgi:hypothetical protein
MQLSWQVSTCDYDNVYVKGLGWVHGLAEQGIWIGTDHGTLLVWILSFCCFWNHDDVTWDCPKRRVLGRRKRILKHIFLGRVKGVVGTL